METPVILSLSIRNSSDAWILQAVALATWSPVNGTEYEFELDIDITVGDTKLFINGIQIGNTQTATGTRNNSSPIIQIGDWIGNPGYHGANFYMRDLIIYNTVQHTVAYTPGYSTENIYTTHISGPAKILGSTIMSDVNMTGRIKSYNSNNLMRNTFSNSTLGTRAVSTWTTRTTPTNNSWRSICWSPELGMFCAVSATGTGNRVMTSSDGIIWTTRASAADNDWIGICWSPELGIFCAVAETGSAN